METETSLSIATVEKACQYVVKRFSETPDNGVFLQDLYNNAKVVDVRIDPEHNTTVSFEVFTTGKLTNTMKMVHGGASSSMFSMFSVLALAADKKYWKTADPTPEELEAFYKDLGVSRSVDIQIIQAVPLNAPIIVKCHILSNTKSNAFVTGGIFNTGGRILVSGTHDMMKQSPASRDPQDPLTLKARYNQKSRL